MASRKRYEFATLPHGGLFFNAILAYAFFMRCVLGFDGGGTKTECVLMDESGEVRARTRTGPSNPTRVGLEVSLESLLDAASSALTKACLTAPDVAVVCGGVAGAGQANLGAQLMKQLQAHFPNAQISIY